MSSCPEKEKYPGVVSSRVQSLLLEGSGGKDPLAEEWWLPLTKTLELPSEGRKVLKVGWEVGDKASLRISSGVLPRG